MVDPILIKEMRELVSAGITVTEVAKRLGTYHQKVSRYTKGIDYPSRLSYRNRGSVETRLKRSKNKNSQSAFFDIIDTEEKVYWLGFLYADGYISKDGLGVVLELASKDRSHVEKFASLFGRPVTERMREQKQTGNFHSSVRCCVSWLYLNNRLTELGYRDKSQGNTEVFNHIPNHLMHHFVRGFFDGDGCFSNSTLSFCGTEQALSAVSHEIAESGAPFRELKKYHSIYTLAWCNKRDVGLIAFWMYKDANVYLERKYKLLKISGVNK